ncbi:arylsulfatase [Horticoccus sp. 23ND18S-11]|uniref:arylsulfatase n=1 Tax=Horticoccus sp. 23ND18S-11 TaxID=3391832 RepID=UPI0039C977F2
MKSVLVWCAFLLSLAAVVAAEPRRPNILIILADDLGYSDLGCYGGEIATPHLDALARGGLRFTQAYNTARCWPSRAAVMTGYYAQQVRRDVVTGIPSGGRGTRPAWAPLLTEFLRPAGYRTYHAGKWHIDGKPLQNGFDHSFEIGNGQNNFFKAPGNTDDGVPNVQTPDYYVTTATAEHAMKYLKEHAEKFAGQPFFQYLCFTAPHFPLHAPAADIAKYRDTYGQGWNAIAEARHARQKEAGLVAHALPPMERDVGPPYSFPDDIVKLGPDEVNRPVPWSELSAAQRKFQAAKMAIHAAMVDRMDQEIGRLIAQLKAMGAYENTLILFASDNGASAEMMVRGDGHDQSAPMGSAKTFLCLGPGWSSAANTPFRRHKTWVHEGGIATPLIVHWPAGIAARGELRHSPTHLVDVLPTVLELTGATKPATIKGHAVPAAPGRSFAPAFAKDVAVPHDFLWWEHEGNRALRAGDWKLVALAKGEWELYDLSRDRGEQNDLAKTRPEKVRELAALWTTQLETTTKLAFTDPPPPDATPKKGKRKQ